MDWRLIINYRILFAISIFATAAISPAPIRDPEAGKHVLPLQTPEQVAAEQKMNGTVPVVGTVPIKTNPDGTGPELKSDTKAANLLSTIRPPGDSQLAAKNVSLASQTLELEGRHGPSAFFLGFIALGILAALLFAGKTYLEKFGPSPDRLKSL